MDIPNRMNERYWQIYKVLGDANKYLFAFEIQKLMTGDFNIGKDLSAIYNTKGTLSRKKEQLPDSEGYKFVYSLNANGKAIYKNLDKIEIKPSNKERIINLKKPPSKDIEIIHQSSIKAAQVTNAVDDLIKENVSLRSALISAMKNQLSELNKIRVMLGYDEITSKDLPENKGNNND